MSVLSTIAIASDHAGVALKAALIQALQQQGYTPLDLGTDSDASVDYPDYADKVVAAVTGHKAAKGILICGSGIGMSIKANRHPAIRAALCYNVETTMLAREHNDANVLVLGARFISADIAEQMVQAFVNTPFSGGRHAGRVAKLSNCY